MIITDALSLHKEIEKRGLHIRRNDGRDNGLYNTLKSLLGCSYEQSLSKFLQIAEITPEAYIRAFLKSSEPFSKMYEEIWDYLLKINSINNSENISIKIKNIDTFLDLKKYLAFQECYTKLQDSKEYHKWKGKLIWKLDFPFKEIFSYKIDMIGYTSGDKLLLPDINISGHKLDKTVLYIRNLFQSIIDDFHILNKKKSWEDIKELEIYNLSSYMTDLLPCWRCFFNEYSSVSTKDKDCAFNLIDGEIFERINDNSTNSFSSDFLQFLNLPFWKQRWQCYEVWSTVIILQGLDNFNPVPILYNNELKINDTKRQVIAKLTNSTFSSACIVIQEQTKKLNNKGMKPDLRICYENKFKSIKNTALVIEFKQRARMTKSYINEIVNRYTAGAPESAGTIIINYDDLDIRLVKSDNKIFMDGVQPMNIEKVINFQNKIIERLNSVNFKKKMKKVFLLDISGSMLKSFDRQEFIFAIKKISKKNDVKLFGFNTSLHELDHNNLHLIKPNKGTDLDNAISDVIEKLGIDVDILIVSDLFDSGISYLNLIQTRQYSIENLIEEVDQIDW